MSAKKIKKSPKAKKATPAKVKKPVKKAKPQKIEKKAKTKAPVVVPPATKPIPAITAQPPRAPQRKVLGGSSAFIRVENVAETTATVAPVLNQPVIVAPAPKKPTPAEVAPIPKISWQKVSVSLPPQTRFLVSMAENECRAASVWPFPYAKFLAALPDQICGQGLGLLLLELDFEGEALEKKTKFAPDFMQRLMEQERSQLLDLFTATCPEMYRKLKTQIGGAGLSIENLLERYLVAKVDRSFQLTIGAVILRALVS